MNFDLRDEQILFRDAAARFLKEQYGPEARRKMLASPTPFNAQIWSRFAEFGWLGLELPEEAGGLNCSFVETAILSEELGRALVLEPYAASAVLAARLLERSQGATHRELLASFVAGKLLIALAHCEAGAQFRLDGVKTAATYTNGIGILLNGAKTLVTAGAAAQHLIVSARLNGSPHFALLLVNAQTPGIVSRAYRLIDGTGAADIEFHGVQLPADALLADTGAAYESLEDAVDRATLALAAEALGAIEGVIEVSAEYLKMREQFGQPIGKFQALQHRMAEMFVEAQEARSILYRGIACLEGSPDERRKAVSAAKVVVARAGRSVGAAGVQLHGGNGVTDEYQVGHYFKKLVAFEKLYGDIEYHTGRFIGRSPRYRGTEDPCRSVHR